MLQLFRKKQQFLAVSYATILHCLVDFCCIYLMMYFVFPACRFTSLSNWLLYTMLYNFIAFAGQLPVGIFGDWLQRNRNLIAVGLLFLLVAYCGALFGFPLLLIVNRQRLFSCWRWTSCNGVERKCLSTSWYFRCNGGIWCIWRKVDFWKR